MKDDIFDWHCNDAGTFTFKSLIRHGFILALEQRNAKNISFFLNMLK